MLVAIATAPQIPIADRAVELTPAETATSSGKAYTLTAVDSLGATLASTVADVGYTDTWLADGEVTLGERAYTVRVDGDSARPTVAIHEEAARTSVSGTPWRRLPTLPSSIAILSSIGWNQTESHAGF